MGFLKALQGGIQQFVAELSGSGGPYVPKQGVGSVLVSPNDHGPRYPAGAFWQLLLEGFQKNPNVYAGAMYLARAIAGSPVRTYDAEGAPLARDPLRDLFVTTNVRDDELELWHLMTLWKLCAGNTYLHKVRNGAGQVVELWPLRPDRVGIVPDVDRVIAAYIYTIAGQRYVVPPEDVLHFRALRTTDDFFGFAPLAAARTAIGTDNEATDYANALLRNSAIPGVVVTTETILKGDKVKRLRALWRKKYGKDKRGEPAFLQKGMDVKLIGLDLQKLAFDQLTDAQEARVLSVLGVPPILVGASAGLKRSTYANYEQARAAFWETTADQWQREFATALMHDPDLRPAMPGSTIAFDNTATPAFKARMDAEWDRVAKALPGVPVISVNEGRARLGLPKSELPEHDEIPQRAAPVAAAPADGEDPEDPARDDAGNLDTSRRKRAPFELRIEHQVLGAAQPAGPRARKGGDLGNLDDSTGRVAKAEKYFDRMVAAARKLFVIQEEDVTAIWRQYSEGQDFTAALEAVIAKHVDAKVVAWSRVADATFHPLISDLMAQSVKDAGAALGESITVERPSVRSFVDSYAFKFAESISSTSADDVRAVMQASLEQGRTVDETAEALKSKFGTWKDSRAQVVAQTETIRSANRGAVLAYREVGITRKRWLASGDACEICLALNGAVTGIEVPFVGRGEEYDPVAADGSKKLSTPFSTQYEDVMSPPAHPNCRCTVVADMDE